MIFADRIVYQRTTENTIGRKLIERDIEAYGKKRCKGLDWVSEKFVSPQRNSVPDQLVSVPANLQHPMGFIFFIEYKAPGKKPTPGQVKDHEERRKRGNAVFVCDSYEETDLVLEIAQYVWRTGELPVLPVFLLT